MEEMKKIAGLSKNRQHLITCNFDTFTYRVEVTNTGTSNTKVSVGIVVGDHKDLSSVSQHRDIVIKPNDSYMFNNIACVKNEKVFIESTMKDVYVSVYNPNFVPTK